MANLINLIILGMGIIFLIIILFTLNYMKKSKEFSYRIVFLRKQNDVIVWYKTIKLNNIDKNIVNFEGNTYHIDVTKSNYINKNKEFVYFVDLDSGSGYMFNSADKIDPKTLKLLVNNNIVSQIVKGVSKSDNFDWKNFLFGVVTGAFIILMIVFIMKSMEEEPTNYVDLPDNLLYIKNLIKGALL